MKYLVSATTRTWSILRQEEDVVHWRAVVEAGNIDAAYLHATRQWRERGFDINHCYEAVTCVPAAAPGSPM